MNRKVLFMIWQMRCPNVALVVLGLILLSGCARIQMPIEGVYPLRAQFSGIITEHNQENAISGAVFIQSDSQAKGQIDGPGGLAAFIISIEKNRINVVDTWGRPVKTLKVPARDFLAILAGMPPRGRYFYRSQRGENMQLFYPWGKVLLDTYRQPRQVYVKSDPPLNIELQPDIQGIRLLIDYASVRLDFTLDILEGGRWRHD